MLKKSYSLLYIFITLISILIILMTYLNYSKSTTKDNLADKKLFVKNIGLPDLAFCTNTSYIRHRSLSSIFSIYNIDGNLRELEYQTFVYSYFDTTSRIINVQK